MNATARNRLDILTNTLVIIVTLLVAAQFFGPRFFGDRALKKGDRLPTLVGYDWTRTPTLAFVLRQGCHFCEASMPFYRHLVSLRDAGRLNAQFIALFPDEGNVGANILKSQNVSMPVFSNIKMRTFKVQGTPTLILADKSGRVSSTWVGELSSTDEENLIQTVQKEQDDSYLH